MVVKDYIKKFDGGYGEIWLYTTSHAHLEVRLTKQGVKGNFHLICEACRHITSPTGWNNITIEIQENSDKTYSVLDRNNNVKIICELILGKENVDPIF